MYVRACLGGALVVDQSVQGGDEICSILAIKGQEAWQSAPASKRSKHLLLHFSTRRRLLRNIFYINKEMTTGEKGEGRVSVARSLL